MSAWPDKPASRARPAAGRRPYSRVGASAASAPASNARVSTPKQRRRQLEIMEVRVRPQRAARLRTQRLLGWSCAVLLVAALAGGIYLAATRGVAWLFFKNPEYNVAVLDVDTDGVISRDAVLDAAEVREGMNIFKLDLDHARARVETLPQVYKVQIQRQLPNKISIVVSERKPVAWVAPDQGAKTREEVFASPRSFLVDAAGVLLRPKKVLAQNYQLPIVRNANADRLAPGQVANTEEMRSALDLLRAHQESLVGARFQIQEVDLARGYGLLVSDRNGLQVLFGLDDPELQLKTLDTLLSAVANSGRRPATISLMTLDTRQRNIPVTFQPEPTPAPPEAPGAEGGGATVGTPPGTPSPAPAPGKKEGTDAAAKAKGKDKSEQEKPKPESRREAGRAHPRTEHPKREKEAEKPAAKPGPTVRRALPVVQPFQPDP